MVERAIKKVTSSDSGCDDADLPRSELDGLDISSIKFYMYHCSDNGSNKLWGYEYHGADTLVVYGAKGQNLNFYRKTHQSELLARNYIDKKVKEKLKKKYTFEYITSFDAAQLRFATP